MAKNKGDYFSNSLPWVQNSQDEEKPIPAETKKTEKQQSENTPECKITNTEKRKKTNTSERIMINTPERVSPNPSEPASNEVLKRQKVTYYINPAFAKKFKILAIELDMEMSELADEAVSDLLKKHGRM
jgi:hypothetical protein